MSRSEVLANKLGLMKRKPCNLCGHAKPCDKCTRAYVSVNFKVAENFIKLLNIVSANLDVLFDYGEVTIFDKDCAWDESVFCLESIEDSFIECLIAQIDKNCDGLSFIKERVQKEIWS